MQVYCLTDLEYDVGFFDEGLILVSPKDSQPDRSNCFIAK